MTAAVLDTGLDVPAVRCENLVRIFSVDGGRGEGRVEVVALQGLDLHVDSGELVAIVGASGSGKSTLLTILSGLDTPSAGSARVAGHDLLSMGRAERVRYQRHTVGFVWQQTARNLLPYLTAAQNVSVPMAVTRMRRAERRERVHHLLDLLGVGEQADRRPSQLSGGQQQRVAIAVALANSPEVLLADEPTGELDSATSDEVFAAFREANRELGVTVVIVTHDQAVSDQVRRTIAIRDGRTSSEVLRRTVLSDSGEEHHVAEEFAVLDAAGRLQLPREFVTALDLRRRVRLALEPDHIQVRPEHEPPSHGRHRAAGAADGTDDAQEGAAVAEQPLVEAQGLDKTFGTGEAAVHALRTVSLRVDAGQLVVVKGRSGSGKTTLLNCLGGLETPDAGTVRIDGADLATMSSDDLVQLRRHRIGYVFQSFGLLPILSAAENVGVPMRLAGRDPRERDARVLELLSLVGLEGHAHQRPYELSGGQQQRVAIARALANDPAVLVADEPTGQLDTATGRAVMDLLRDLVHSRRLTAVVATHDPVMVAMADRVIDLADGAVVADTEAAVRA